MMKLKFIVLITIILLNLNIININSQKIFYGYIKNGRFLVPLRGVFEEFGAKVYWDDSNKSIKIILDDVQIFMIINYKYAMVNENVYILDVPPEINNGRTYIPLRFVAESIGAKVEWYDKGMFAYIKYRDIEIIVKEASNESLKISIENKKILGYSVNLVKIPYEVLIQLIPRVVLAQNKISGRENFKSIINRTNPVVAINGAFFNANNEPPDPNEPYGFFMNDGVLFHINRNRAVLGFNHEMITKIDRINVKFTGYVEVDGFDQPQKFYINRINHTPDINDVVIYTKEWGKNLIADNYPVIYVSNNIIKYIYWGGSIEIPDNGYLILMKGEYIYSNDISRFKVGNKIWYEIEFSDINGNLLDPFWNDIFCAIGCGPALVLNGKVDCKPELEGFDNVKITTNAGQRSAIGITKDRTLLLVTVSNVTIYKLAEIMKSLDAYYAMNLDGGASSALYVNGKYITMPGRDLNNVLIFIRK